MEISSIAAVASVVLVFAAAFLGAKYRKWIRKARLFAGLLGEIISAAEDEVSEEEFQRIVVAAKKVVAKEEGG